MTNTREKLPVLLVEDDPLIALDAEDTLTIAGFACLLAYNTDTAMDLLKAHEIRVAILDFDLGDETSLCIAEQVYGSDIPYAFVTGRSRGEIIGHAPGPFAILSKPVDYADVARQLSVA